MNNILKEPVTVSRHDRKKEEIRKRIIDSAMCLFQKNGFDSTTMEQIAEEADIARRTLYNHFSLKEAILSEFVQRSIQKQGLVSMEMLSRIKDTRTRIMKMLQESLQWATTQFEVFKVYFAYRMQKKFQLQEDLSIRSGFFNLVAEIVRLGQESGELRADLPVESLVNHLELVYAAVVFELLSGKTQDSLQTTIEQHVDIFLDGAKQRS